MKGFGAAGGGQPRVPAGSSKGGEFAGKGGGRSLTTPGRDPIGGATSSQVRTALASDRQDAAARAAGIDPAFARAQRIMAQERAEKAKPRSVGNELRALSASGGFGINQRHADLSREITDGFRASRAPRRSPFS